MYETQKIIVAMQTVCMHAYMCTNAGMHVHLCLKEGFHIMNFKFVSVYALRGYLKPLTGRSCSTSWAAGNLFTLHLCDFWVDFEVADLDPLPRCFHQTVFLEEL